MAKKKICPFQSFGTREQTQECTENLCALWVQEARLGGTVGCSFRAMATRLGVIEDRLNTIAMKVK
jgi:hypothetical protein